MQKKIETLGESFLNFWHYKNMTIITLFLVLHIRQLCSRTETVVSHCAAHPSNANTRERHCLFSSFLVACAYLVGPQDQWLGWGKRSQMDALNFPLKTFFRAQMKN